MEYFTKKRFVIWIIVILVLVNITALATIIIQNRKMHSFSKPNKHTEKNEFPDFIKGELGLDDAQSGKFNKLMEEHFSHIGATMKKIIDLRNKTMEAIFSDNPDSNLIKKYSEDIGKLQTELEADNMNHFLKLKTVCTPEQQKKLINLMKELPFMKHRENDRMGGDSMKGFDKFPDDGKRPPCDEKNKDFISPPPK